MFFGTTAPEFKIKLFKAKSGGEEAIFLLVKTAQGKEDEVRNKFPTIKLNKPVRIHWMENLE
jgi:hypothetical protein